MGKSFLIKFPPDYPVAERERINQMLDRQCFIRTLVCGEVEVEYFFEGDRYMSEKLREEFQIPAEVEVLETTHSSHNYF